MSAKEKAKTTVGIGISINYKNPPIKMIYSCGGTLRILVAGIGEWEIAWAICEMDTMRMCQLGTEEKAHMLFVEDYAEKIIFMFLEAFTRENWDQTITTHHPDDEEVVAAWTVENPSIYYSTSDLDQKTICQLIGLCNRTCKSRTEVSTGEPD